MMWVVQGRAVTAVAGLLDQLTVQGKPHGAVRRGVSGRRDVPPVAGLTHDFTDALAPSAGMSGHASPAQEHDRRLTPGP